MHSALSGNPIGDGPCGKADCFLRVPSLISHFKTEKDLVTNGDEQCGIMSKWLVLTELEAVPINPP